MDENGSQDDERDPRTDRGDDPSGDDLIFPTVEEIVANNSGFLLLDEEARHPEIRPIDPSVPPAGGDPDFDWKSLRQVNDTWAKMALKMYGRVGRDPARIEPFLRSFEAIWNRHSNLKFGKIVCDALSFRQPPLSLHLPEEETVAERLREWDETVGKDESTPSTNNSSSDLHIRRFLDRFQEAWEREPDQRFGQLVANIIRFKQPLDSLESIEDADYLGLIDDWIGVHR